MLADKEFNILIHSLVPEHIILNEKEQKELLEKMNILPNQLPKMRKNDAVSKKLEAKEGDVIKITRPSITLLQSVDFNNNNIRQQ